MALHWELPKKNGFFITGTDTGVGKTLIAGAIAHILTQKGLKVGVFKPVATGCRSDREGLVSCDAEFLAHFSNSESPLAVINPVTFSIPAAPIVCQERENRKIDFEQITAAYRHICKTTDIVIVEGIGGFRVPIIEDVDVRDMAVEFGLPVVVVARPGLGTINHTLLTIESVRSAGLKIAGVIINGYNEPTAGIPERTNPSIIAQQSGVEVLIVPFDEDSSVEKALLGQPVISSLASCDWQKLAKI